MFELNFSILVIISLMQTVKLQHLNSQYGAKQAKSQYKIASNNQQLKNIEIRPPNNAQQVACSQNKLHFCNIQQLEDTSFLSFAVRYQCHPEKLPGISLITRLYHISPPMMGSQNKKEHTSQALDPFQTFKHCNPTLNIFRTF